MIGFSGLNYGSLFGIGNRTSYTGSIFSNLSQYTGARSSAYSKALRSYYAGTGSQNTLRRTMQKNHLNTSVYNAEKTLTEVKQEASEVVVSAGKLMSGGKNGLFKSEDTYDPDAACKAVGDFVNNYNDTIEALSKTDNSVVKSAGNSMNRMTGLLKNSLQKAGVTVTDDGKLSLNEEEFKKADMNTVKSLFGGTSSYAKLVSSSAQRVQSAVSAQQRVYTGSVYGRNLSYYNNLYSGYGFNGYF